MQLIDICGFGSGTVTLTLMHLDWFCFYDRLDERFRWIYAVECVGCQVMLLRDVITLLLLLWWCFWLDNDFGCFRRLGLYLEVYCFDQVELWGDIINLFEKCFFGWVFDAWLWFEIVCSLQLEDIWFTRYKVVFIITWHVYSLLPVNLIDHASQCDFITGQSFKHGFKLILIPNISNSISISSFLLYLCYVLSRHNSLLLLSRSSGRYLLMDNFDIIFGSFYYNLHITIINYIDNRSSLSSTIY